MATFPAFLKISAITVIAGVLACNGVQSGMTNLPKNSRNALSGLSESDWQKFIKREAPAGSQIVWKIQITDVSFFGGFYVKGHLVDSRNARVHLIWSPQSPPSGSLRERLAEGAIITVLGNFEGVTEEQEVIIGVRECVY